jgi:anti-sigma regulatory factor (Ser/Thr protein kinase)
MQGLDVLHEPDQSSRVMGCRVPIVGTTTRIPIGSHTDIVIARQEARALSKTMNCSATDSAFIATTVSEFARALLSRTVLGEIRLHAVSDAGRSGMAIVMRVPGPFDGERHPVTSDLDLHDVRQLVDEFDVAADHDGTTIRATKWCRQR